MCSRDEADDFARLALRSRAATARSFDRMRRGPAHRRCHGKTGHALERERAVRLLRGALSGDIYAYSILMNGVYPTAARRLQDRMLQAIAKYG